MPLPQPDVPVPPWRLSGVVYGALLNHAPALAALGEAVNQPPYQAPPRAPVLQLKPRNSLAGDGARVPVPAGGVALAAGVELGATLGLVIARSACRVAVADALDHVAGYLVVADLSLGGDGPVLGQHYRPAVRQRARDGFCVLGPRVAPAAALAQPDALALRIFIDGQLAQATDTARRVRGVAQLIADVTEFMTLRVGDLLLLGASVGAPVAHAGQAVAIDIDGLDGLRVSLVAESAIAAVDDPRASP